MTLVGVGHALADAFAFTGVDGPQALGLHPGTFQRVPDYRIRAILAAAGPRPLAAGGSAANVTKYAARLGLDAAFVGRCGHDEAGRVFEAELLAAGVRPTLVKTDDPTGLCFTFLSPPALRTTATFRSASAGFTADQVSADLVAAADVVVAEGYLLDEPEFLKALAAQARRAGTPVALDLAEGTAGPGQREVLKGLLASGGLGWLFLEEADGASLTGRDAAGTLAALRDQGTTAVVRRGDRGWLVLEGGRLVAVPRAEGPLTDPTGASDAFQAGWFWALDRGLGPSAAARAGSLAAAAVASVAGTRPDEASWARLGLALEALAAGAGAAAP